jgi:hypothetical protein
MRVIVHDTICHVQQLKKHGKDDFLLCGQNEAFWNAFGLLFANLKAAKKHSGSRQ